MIQNVSSSNGYRRRQERMITAGDGTRLWARHSAGPGATGMPILCANGIGVSTIFWRYIDEHFSGNRPVITWDYRGHGNSEHPRDLDDLTIESLADDMARVLDAFGYDRAICLGHSMGCQVIYTFAHRHAERTAALVPMLGTYGRPVHTFLDREVPSLISFLVSYHVGLRIPDLVTRVKRRALASPRGRRLVSKLSRLSGLVHAHNMPQERLEEYLDHFGALSPVVFLRMAEKMALHTTEHYLHEIAAPTLVVAGGLDIFTPLYLSEIAAERLPNSKLLILGDGSHAALVEQPERINAEIESFLAEFQVEPAAARPERLEERLQDALRDARNRFATEEGTLEDYVIDTVEDFKEYIAPMMALGKVPKRVCDTLVEKAIADGLGEELARQVIAETAREHDAVLEER